MKLLGVGGGAFKGAYSKPIVQSLLDEADAEGRPYDAALGTSVGALELAMELSGKRKTHDAMWAEMDTKHALYGVPGFLKPIWWKYVLYAGSLSFLGDKIWPVKVPPPEALFDASPLLKKIRHHVDPKDFRCPLAVGAVDKVTGLHHTIVIDRDTPKDFAHEAIYASALMNTIMRPFERDGQEWIDGGHAHVIPPVPAEWMPEAKANLSYDVVFHQEMHPKAASKRHMDILGNAAWSFDYALRRIVLEDYEDLYVLAMQGAKVRVWSPKESIGEMLDVTRETLAFRMKLGEKDIPRFERLGKSGEPTE